MSRAYLEATEIQSLEQAANYMRDKLLIRLLFRLGCRISEALALQVNDIDFEGGTVTIEHLKSRLKLSCPKCGARLGKSHTYCPKCGVRVEEAVAKEQEHRRNGLRFFASCQCPYPMELLCRIPDSCLWTYPGFPCGDYDSSS